MSAFAGSLFKRDVALVEETIQKDDYLPFTVSDSPDVNILTFSEDAGESIVKPTTCVINSIQLQGQSVEEFKFHVTTVDSSGATPIVTKGAYIVNLTIDNQPAQIELPVSNGTNAVDLELHHVLGKQETFEFVESETVDFEVNSVKYRVKANAVTDLRLFVEFDKIGKPDMTWKTTSAGYVYTDTDGNVNFKYNKYGGGYTATATIALTGSASATAGKAKYLWDCELDKITFNGSYDADAKTITVTQVDFHAINFNGTDGDSPGVDFYESNQNFSIAVSPNVVLPVKEANTEGRLAVVGTGSDINFSTSSNVVIDSITCEGLQFTLYATHPEFFVSLESTDKWVSNLELYDAASTKTNNSPLLYQLNKLNNFEEVIHFKDGSADRNDIVTIAPGATFYEKFLEPGYGNVLNVSHDAGFLIPVQQNDYQMEQKYVRISDIYNKLNSREQVEVPKLADRLHALEVALSYESSDVLDSTDPEAVRLQALKDQYSALDISNL